jgi:3-deoxy-D-manno-octulosonic-acid transferase
MYFLYSLALSIAFLVLLPYFAYQAIRHGKYASSFKERLGVLRASLRNDGSPVIWIHTVSVGEFLAAEPLIEALKARFPAYRLAISTTTLTGQRLARTRLGLESEAAERTESSAPGEPSNRGAASAKGSLPQGIAGVFYFPFDWTFAVRRSLKQINPILVIVLETEIWPAFLRECRRRNTPVILANGRISPRSQRRYMRVRGLIRRALLDISLLAMQSEGDAQRAISLGANQGSVTVCGNLKYDVRPVSTLPPVSSMNTSQLPCSLTKTPAGETLSVGPSKSKTEPALAASNSVGHRGNASPEDRGAMMAAELDRVFALAASRNLIVAGSTAPGEESMLLSALRIIKSENGPRDTRLVIAPRHPERFGEVAKLISGSGFSFVRRSDAHISADKAAVAQVILLDSIGELACLYRFASVVFVGGSLVPRGGHNIIEAAVYARPIVVGPYTENFRQIVSDFREGRAVSQLPRDSSARLGSALTRELARLLTDTGAALEMGAAAKEILCRNQGAVDRTVERIAPILERAAGSPSGGDSR